MSERPIRPTQADGPSDPPTGRCLWLDGDPGFDDWLAWVLLMALPGVQVAGIGLVAGNAPLPVVLDNARRIRELHGWQLPLHTGCDRPLHGPAITAAYVLGEAGMRSTGPTLPPAEDTPRPGDSADAAAALLQHLQGQRRSGRRTTVLATGPLTNLATALQRDRSAFDAVDQLLLMGGSTDRGNHTPAAEFNIAADPEAADVVFRSGVPIRMFGLNLCRQLGLTQAHVQQATQALEQASPRAVAAHLPGYLDAYQRIASAATGHDGAQPMPLYDPAPVLWLAAPELFDFQAAPVDVELHGRFTRGMTVVDLRNRERRPAPVQVAVAVQAQAALQRLLQLLSTAG